MSASEPTPSTRNQNTVFMKSSSDEEDRSSNLDLKSPERIGISSRSFVFPESLKNLKADLMATSTPKATQLLPSDANNCPNFLPKNSLVQSQPEHHHQQEDRESQRSSSGPLHRRIKQECGISPSIDSKSCERDDKYHRSCQEGESCLSSCQKTFPPLWTEEFAKGVTKSVKRVVDDIVSRGSLAHTPPRRIWSSLSPEDIIRPSFCELGNGEGEGGHVLGSGSFSKVIQVQIKGRKGNGSNSFVALKRLKGDLLPSKLTENSCRNGSVAAFKKAATELAREAFLLSRFDHPHIINILGWTSGGVTSYSAYRRHDAYFLVLELLQEETLEDRIEEWNQDDGYLQLQRCAEDERKVYAHRRKMEQLTICRQIASALSYIHSKNVVYRDLKPQNIGFARGTNNGGDDYGDRVVVKLMDFGLARELPTSGIIQSHAGFQEHVSNSSLFDMTGTVGTIRYMAPEVCLNRPYGLECDVYSWSIVAHEILSQTKPFNDMTPDMYQSLVCQRGVRPPTQNMPSEHIILLTQAWRTDPSKRLPFNRIKRQLDLFIKQEKLIWEAQELLSELPENIASKNSHPDSITQNGFNVSDNSSQGGTRRRNKRTWECVYHEDANRSRVPDENPIFNNISMDYHGEHHTSNKCDHSYGYENCYSHNKAPRKSPIFEVSPSTHRHDTRTDLSPPQRRPEPVTPDQRHRLSHERSCHSYYESDHKNRYYWGDGYHEQNEYYTYSQFGHHRQVSPSNDYGHWGENF